jgi:hypothetical protein
MTPECGGNCHQQQGILICDENPHRTGASLGLRRARGCSLDSTFMLRS